MSSGAVTVPAHSPGCQVQNWTHPAGGRVTSETRTWASRSGSATTGSASTALAASATINAVPDLTLKTLEITVAIINEPRRRPRPATVGTAPCGLPNRCAELRRATPAHR